MKSLSDVMSSITDVSVPCLACVVVVVVIVSWYVVEEYQVPPLSKPLLWVEYKPPVDVL